MMTNVLYFLAGVAATLAGLWSLVPGDERKQWKKRGWITVERLTWTTKFDHTYEKPVDGNTFGRAVAYWMDKQIVTTPFPEFTVKPGLYSVNITVVANFVRRE